MKKYILIAIWMVFLGFGSWYLWSYENTPGATAHFSSHIPARHNVALDAERPTIIVFAHPHCPCSRASISELTKSLSQFQNKFRTKVYFYIPPGKDIQWAHSSLWEKTQRLPDTEVFIDPDGKIARAFEAKISGETFVLSPQDKILYHGGMTASRGHEGESAGSRGLADIARRGVASVVESPVFGCSLFKEETLSPGGS